MKTPIKSTIGLGILTLAATRAATRAATGAARAADDTPSRPGTPA